MINKQTEKLMRILLVLSGILILAGALSKLQHYPFGSVMLWTGFLSNFILSGIEINRLKKIIKGIEIENNTPETK